MQNDERGMQKDPADTTLLSSLITRPPEQRAREFKYRFAQSLVFGLPVLALQRYGRALGWVEADRWVGLLQLVLAGWVLYVASAGMLFEGVLTLRRRVSADLLVALAAVTAYVLSISAVAAALFGRTPRWPPRFDAVVALLIFWSAVRWWWLSR
jgi:cation transport ATPase